jgi:arsenate reductase-like glutaredoxin family protein
MKMYLISLGIPVSKTQDSHPQDEFHSMLTTASHLIKVCRQVDKDFRAMVATAESVQKELKKDEAKNTWQKDQKDAAQLLEKGMRLSMKRIDQLIPDTEKADKQANSTGISSDFSYNEVSVYFTNTHPQEKRLRETLAQTTKGVKRIVRFLPEQEDI